MCGAAGSTLPSVHFHLFPCMILASAKLRLFPVTPTPAPVPILGASWSPLAHTQSTVHHPQVRLQRPGTPADLAAVSPGQRGGGLPRGRTRVWRVNTRADPHVCRPRESPKGRSLG